MIEHLARYTGLSKQYIQRNNLRIDLSHFDAELLRDEDQVVGRLDGRFKGADASQAERTPDYDPSEAAIRPPYTTVFGSYSREELHYQSDLTYFILGGGIGSWDYGTTGESGFADTSAALRHAFATNPYMRVFIAEGMYDAATPYFAVDYTFNHMGLTGQAHQNITRSHFQAGHMMYIDEPSILKLKNDVDNFYEQTAPR